MKTVTHRQMLVLRAIAQYSARAGFPPTLRDVGKILGIKSTNGVSDHYKALERKGLIRRIPMVSRGVFVSPDGRRALGGNTNG